MNVRVYEPTGWRMTARLIGMEVVGSVAIAVVLYLVGRGFRV